MHLKSLSTLFIFLIFEIVNENSAENSDWRCQPNWSRPKSFIIHAPFGERAKVTVRAVS